MANTAALIQIMSVGKQNKILNAEPEITFWRFTHMRYTDFALEQVRVTSNGSNTSLQPNSGTIHFDLPRAGDLMRNAFGVFHFPGLVNLKPDVTLNDMAAAPVIGGDDGGLAVFSESDGDVAHAPGQSWVNGALYPGDSGAAQRELAKYEMLNEITQPFKDEGFAEYVEDRDERQAIYKKAGASKLKLVAGPQPYWIKNIGQYLVQEIRLQVGSQVVDTVYDHFLRAWDELSDKPGRVLSSNYGEMTMNGTAKQRKQWSRKRRSVFVPIPMFFSRTSGNSMPLVALSFHGVKFVLKTSAFSRCIMQKDAFGSKTYVRTNQIANHSAERSDFDIDFQGENDVGSHLVKANDVSVDMQIGFVYLGLAEREKFSDASFDILIDQVQKNDQPLNENGSKVTLNNIGFNHCVQEIVWVVTYEKGTGADAPEREPMDYSGPIGNDGQPMRSVVGVQLRINNSKRLTHLDGEEVPGDYFCQLDPYLHHTRVPNDVYAYSWAITPEGHQPSGACNFSRIDHASFEIRTRKLDTTLLQQPHLHLYARNWNCFRVSLGVGGLKWAS